MDDHGDDTNDDHGHDAHGSETVMIPETTPVMLTPEIKENKTNIVPIVFIFIIHIKFDFYKNHAL